MVDLLALQIKLEILNERLDEVFDEDIEEYNEYKKLGDCVESVLNNIEILKVFADSNVGDNLLDMDIMNEIIKNAKF